MSPEGTERSRMHAISLQYQNCQQLVGAKGVTRSLWTAVYSPVPIPACTPVLTPTPVSTPGRPGTPGYYTVILAGLTGVETRFTL